MAGYLETKLRLLDLLEQVHAHPMCANFEQTTTHYKVAYPPKIAARNVQVSYVRIGKQLALIRLLEVMEREHGKQRQRLC